MANNSMTNAITGQNPNVVGSQQADFLQKLSEYSAQDSRFDKLIGEHEAYFETLKRLREKSALDEIESNIRATEESLRKRLAAENLSAEQRKAIEQECNAEIARLRQDHADTVKDIEDRAMKATLIRQENTYKYGTLAEKKALQERRAANAKALAEQSIERIRNSQKDSETDLQFRLRCIEEERQAREQANAIAESEQFQSIQEVREKMKNFKADAEKGDFSVIGSMVKVAGSGLKDIAAEAKQRSQRIQSELNKQAEDYESQKKLSAARLDEIDELLNDENVSDEDKEALRKEQDEIIKKQEEAQERIAKLQGEALAAELESVMADFAENLKNAVGKEFQAAESLLLENKAWIEGRLQGSDRSYNKVMNEISSNLSMSPFVKTKDVIKKMHDAVERGIAYNVEQRSFLAGISDKIANTFNAFESNLTRLIRLQQADTTAARLGMEASLTKFFNKNFQDNSYLKDVADTISGAIIDANASMSRDTSAAFEYTVQKWLGSLYSLGMDQGTLGEIAKGINYIATGDVTSLSSNTSLQTLFAMSASNAGLSYSDLLLNGLDADTTNRLLESMVVYLKEIAENSDNQVVRSAYGNIFNLSMSDMRAVSNLTTNDIKKITGSSLEYNDMMSELNMQFVKQITRTTLGSMLNTLYENATFGIAEDLVSNPATYAMYKMLNFMDERKFDMAIPFLNVYGFGLDLNTSVQDLLRLGLGVGSAMSLVGNLLGGLGSVGGMNLDGWKASEYTSRGGGLAFTTRDGGASVSGSASFFDTSDGDDGSDSSASYVGSGSGEDMQKSSLSSATDDAEETSKTTNKNSDAGYTMDDFYKAVVEGSEPYLRVTDEVLKSVYYPRESFLHTRDTRAVYTRDGYLKVFDIGLSDGMDIINEYLETIDKSTYSIADDTTDLLKYFINAGNILVGLANDATRERISNVSTQNALSTTTVRVSNNTTDTKGLDVFVTNMAGDAKAQIVKFEDNKIPEVTISKELLIDAFQQALGFTSPRDGFKSMAEVLNDLYNGDASLTVKTNATAPLDTLTTLVPATVTAIKMALP